MVSKTLPYNKRSQKLNNKKGMPPLISSSPNPTLFLASLLPITLCNTIFHLLQNLHHKKKKHTQIEIIKNKFNNLKKNLHNHKAPKTEKKNFWVRTMTLFMQCSYSDLRDTNVFIPLFQCRIPPKDLSRIYTILPLLAKTKRMFPIELHLNIVYYNLKLNNIVFII